MGKTRVSTQAVCLQKGAEPGKWSNVASDVWICADLSEHHALLVLHPVKINKGSVRNSNIEVLCKYYAVKFRDSPYFGHNAINHLFATNNYSCGYLEIKCLHSKACRAFSALIHSSFGQVSRGPA